MELQLLHKLGIAVGLGLLVGLERQAATKEVAGIRTFPLITVLGALAGALTASAGGWVVAAGILAVATMFVFGNVARVQKGEFDAGLTTEMAGLVMFFVGALLVLGDTTAAIVVGAGVSVLLYWKRTLHSFAERIGEPELRAIIRFVLIGLVILPALPDRSFDIYGVINPFEIWLMVVLIVGISLGAYVAYRMLGARAGTLAAGLLGGLISSTATTVSYARIGRASGTAPGMPAIVIVLASTVVFARVLFEIGLVAGDHFRALAAPIAAMMAVLVIVALTVYLGIRGSFAAESDREPPSDLRAAITFGLLYALVLFTVAAAQRHFGESGLYVAAALSGLTDMDAITLSTAKLVQRGEIAEEIGWRAIVIGAMANMVFKGAVVLALGTRAIFWRVAAAFGVGIGAGIALLLFWPG